ncbi:hypothetical protein A3E62_03240 [Candidatus Giovannonibacteria bacterium RIFCSPHIGHO2_12_FULL_44_29]|nr:MAG: hypothetical protein A3E62_03240 [Candidatus Giovannonibacteria bacterium RIFCSPHIGHO2_12_FULL_44_29]
MKEISPIEIGMARPTKVLFLGTYPPRRCGIATFTYDLAQAFYNTFAPAIKTTVAAMNYSALKNPKYSSRVVLEIDQDKTEDYKIAAKKINADPNIKLVCIQHEFGIFGGEFGSNLKYFLAELKKPTVMTLHTVLPNPKPAMEASIRPLLDRVSYLVVMSTNSKNILISRYGINPRKIFIIDHGIHPVEFETSEKFKKALHIQNRQVMSTFGLLNPGKGIEYVLDVIPELIRKFPNLLYLVMGVTHPLVLKNEGEEYRNFLMEKANQLKIQKYVRFYNLYLEVGRLLKFLQATDIYIASSTNVDQAVSGTFSYAMGTGRPIISAPFAQAREDIGEAGLLVNFRDKSSLKKTIEQLLVNPKLREVMGKKAYFNTRHMTWSNVALSYLKVFMKCAPDLSVDNRHLPKLNLKHLNKLTDRFGIFQFADLSHRNPDFGYTLDDNARALVIAARYYSAGIRKKTTLRLLNIYLSFIANALGSDGFLNYFNKNYKPDDAANAKDNLEDADARALWALMQLSVIHAIPVELKRKAQKIYKRRLKIGVHFQHIRPKAFYIKGLFALYQSHSSQNLREKIRILADELMKNYVAHSDSGWHWFDSIITYSNSVLCESLLSAFQATGKEEYFYVGKKTLDFLISHSFVNGIYMPVGQSGWFEKGGKRKFFDQQPEDVVAMVEALKKIYIITREEKYKMLMTKAFYWYLGENYLEQYLYDQISGGCYDGLGKRSVNLNQGAESTVSYLAARIAVNDSS